MARKREELVEWRRFPSLWAVLSPHPPIPPIGFFGVGRAAGRASSEVRVRGIAPSPLVRAPAKSRVEGCYVVARRTPAASASPSRM